MHYDPYDAGHVFVRTQDGWITVPWTHLPMISAPFAEFTWQRARRMAAEKGSDDTNETEVARVLDDLLARPGPADKRAGRVAARTRQGAAAHRPRRAITRLANPRPEAKAQTRAGRGEGGDSDPVRDLRRRRRGVPVVTAAGSGPATAEEPLTTKEGWRRFADRQTAMPDLPGPDALARMTARERAGHDEARQVYHADLPLANTPVIQRVVATTRLLIQLNRHQARPPRGDRVRPVGHREDHRADPAGPDPRAAHPQPLPGG